MRLRRRNAAAIIYCRMNETGGLILGLAVAIAALSTLARLINVPYPIVLVIGGLGIGLIPGLPDVTLDPDLVLVIFLPPLLYAAAFFASLRDLRRNLRPITLTAVGLVIATAVGVALVAHTLIDGMTWGAAFALGAIVAPTDPIAASAIMKRLGAPRRIVTVIEGESLINDGTALVIYRSAVAAVVGGSFSIWSGGLDFVLAVIGGIAMGLLVGGAIAEIRRRIEDTPVEITISLATGYAAYLPAEAINVSGVLAAVTAGIYLGWKAPEIASVTQRLQGRPVWELLQFLLNAVLFVLIGLQLPIVVGNLGGISAMTLVGYAAAICATVVGVRLIWSNTTPYLVRALDRRPQQRARRVDWHSVHSRPHLRAFWTPRRIRQAEPMSVLTFSKPGGHVVEAGDASPAAADPSADGTDTGDPTLYPNSANGVVLFFYGADEYRCSGSVINSPAGNVVLTAGHCVIAPGSGTQATNIVFIPGYRDGEHTFDDWPATTFATTTEWQTTAGTGDPNDADEAGDMAMLTLQTVPGMGRRSRAWSVRLASASTSRAIRPTWSTAIRRRSRTTANGSTS